MVSQIACNTSLDIENIKQIIISHQISFSFILRCNSSMNYEQEEVDNCAPKKTRLMIAHSAMLN